jgi:hypothetical protein
MFKLAWKNFKAVYGITTPQDKVTLKQDYMNLAFEEAYQCLKTCVLKLAEIRDKLKKIMILMHLWVPSWRTSLIDCLLITRPRKRNGWRI